MVGEMIKVHLAVLHFLRFGRRGLFYAQISTLSTPSGTRRRLLFVVRSIHMISSTRTRCGVHVFRGFVGWIFDCLLKVSG